MKKLKTTIIRILFCSAIISLAALGLFPFVKGVGEDQIGKDHSANYLLNCEMVGDKKYFLRCENHEVICYSKDGLSCKFKTKEQTNKKICT